ncbi:MAG TPA: hypothetical protein VGM88_07070 [Kofleriaceae bacterium]
MTTTKTRRAVIVELVRVRDIGTQEELRAALKTRGHAVTQATLSRDLASLGAKRVSRPGRTAYELAGAESATGGEDAELRALAPLVVSVQAGDALLVLHTQPGAAAAIAAVIDRARLGGVLGTIAGDDTIFVCPARGVQTATAAKYFSRMFRKEPA